METRSLRDSPWVKSTQESSSARVCRLVQKLRFFRDHLPANVIAAAAVEFFLVTF